MPRRKNMPLKCVVKGPTPARRSPRAPARVPVKFNTKTAAVERRSSKNNANDVSSLDADPQVFVLPVVAPSIISSNSNKKRKMDTYCWLCHTLGGEQECQECPRIYHQMCLNPLNRFTVNGICPECRLKSIDGTEMNESLSVQKLSELLPLALNRLLHKVTAFKSWSGSERDNRNLICVMDLSMMEDKLNLGFRYTSTSSFLADIKWIPHNCHIVYGAHNALTTKSKNLIKECREELMDLEACPECYLKSYSMDKNFFVNLCSKPHTIVWAKIKGFPYWPSKVLKVIDGMAYLRFFGSHDKGKVAANQCFLLSEKSPADKVPNKANYRHSLLELEGYIKLYAEKYKEFKYADVKTPYYPGDDNMITKQPRKLPQSRKSLSSPPKAKRGRYSAPTSPSRAKRGRYSAPVVTPASPPISPMDPEVPLDEPTPTEVPEPEKDVSPSQLNSSSQEEVEEMNDDDEDVKYIGEETYNPNKHNFMSHLQLSPDIVPQMAGNDSHHFPHHDHMPLGVLTPLPFQRYQSGQIPQTGAHRPNLEMLISFDQDMDTQGEEEESDSEFCNNLVDRLVDVVANHMDSSAKGPVSDKYHRIMTCGMMSRGGDEPVGTSFNDGELDIEIVTDQGDVPVSDHSPSVMDGTEVILTNAEINHMNNFESGTSAMYEMHSNPHERRSLCVLPLTASKYTNKMTAVMQEIWHDLTAAAHVDRLTIAMKKENEDLREAKKKEEARANEIKTNTDLILKTYRETFESEKQKAVTLAEEKWQLEHDKEIKRLDTSNSNAQFELTKKVKELTEKVAKLEEEHKASLFLQKTKHDKELTELKLAKLKATQDAIVETRKSCSQEEKARIDDVKRNSWCATCLGPARFYCCWNTNYCSVKCQHQDWVKHFEICEQAQNPDSQFQERPKDNRGSKPTMQVATSANGLKSVAQPSTYTLANNSSPMTGGRALLPKITKNSTQPAVAVLKGTHHPRIAVANIGNIGKQQHRKSTATSDPPTKNSPTSSSTTAKPEATNAEKKQ